MGPGPTPKPTFRSLFNSFLGLEKEKGNKLTYTEKRKLEKQTKKRIKQMEWERRKNHAR